jgi:dephospho-CoA kinase
MKLGLTGGIGCGKSTALAYLQNLGWHTLQADALAKGLLDTEAEVKTAIAQQWPQVLNSDNTIDRSALAAIVFSDADSLRWLEGLLHPIVRRHWQEWLDRHNGQACAIEIPLLFEKQLQGEFDATLCIAASDAAVYRRMQARGFSSDQVAARAERQWPLPQKIQAADFVIWNDGEEAFLKAQLDALDQQLKASLPKNH